VQRKTSSSRLRQLGWLVILWVAGVTAVGVLALVLRGLMAMAGMTA
jgi:hypothetical protein